MNIKIINTTRNAEKYLHAVEQEKADLQVAWNTYMIETFWSEIAQWAPFDMSYLKPEPIYELSVLMEQIEQLSQLSTAELQQKFSASVNALPVEDDDELLIAIYPLCDRNKTAKERQNGVVGANVFGNMILNVNPLADDWQAWIPYVFAHEYHHKAWGHHWYVMQCGQGLDGTFLEYLINEGQADLFAMSLYPNLQPQWNEPFSKAIESTLWTKMKLALDSTDREIHEKYMFGSEELDLPWCVGYSFGRMIVADYLEQNPEINFTELIKDRKSVV